MLSEARGLKNPRTWVELLACVAGVWLLATWLSGQVALSTLDRAWAPTAAVVLIVAMAIAIPSFVPCAIHLWRERDPEVGDFIGTVALCALVTIGLAASAVFPLMQAVLIVSRWLLYGFMLFFWACVLGGTVIRLIRLANGQKATAPQDPVPLTDRRLPESTDERQYSGAPFPTLPLEQVVTAFQVHNKLNDGTAVSRLRALAPSAFESWVARQLRRQGYTVEERGGQSDHGIDLVARRRGRTVVVQCKKLINRKVGEPDLRDLTGVLNRERADRVMMITTTGFTSEAMTWLATSPGDIRDSFELWDAFTCDQLADAPEDGPAPLPSPLPLMPCPRCGGWLVRRHSWQGWLVGCSNYGPLSCRYVRDLRSERQSSQGPRAVAP